MRKSKSKQNKQEETKDHIQLEDVLKKIQFKKEEAVQLFFMRIML